MSANVFKGKKEEEKNYLEEILEHSIEVEEDLMRTYLITAERIHDAAAREHVAVEAGLELGKQARLLQLGQDADDPAPTVALWRRA